MKKKIARRLYKNIRNRINCFEKTEFDKRIFSCFINSCFIMKYDLFLIYISVGSEVDTIHIINYLLNNHKRVAIPVCNENKMDFYEINNLNELNSGKFGIPTVDSGNNQIISNFENSLCVVPAVCFDIQGNRIGYGGGYYDRFLSANKVDTVGLCYERCLCTQIDIKEFDVSVDYVLTENRLFKI